MIGAGTRGQVAARVPMLEVSCTTASAAGGRPQPACWRSTALACRWPELLREIAADCFRPANAWGCWSHSHYRSWTGREGPGSAVMKVRPTGRAQSEPGHAIVTGVRLRRLFLTAAAVPLSFWALQRSAPAPPGNRPAARLHR